MLNQSLGLGIELSVDAIEFNHSDQCTTSRSGHIFEIQMIQLGNQSATVLLHPRLELVDTNAGEHGVMGDFILRVFLDSQHHHGFGLVLLVTRVENRVGGDEPRQHALKTTRHRHILL
jgi:hypothetical protein